VGKRECFPNSLKDRNRRLFLGKLLLSEMRSRLSRKSSKPLINLPGNRGRKFVKLSKRVNLMSSERADLLSLKTTTPRWRPLSKKTK